MLHTDDLAHDDNQQVCHNHGGFLPEPRDEHDNQFLNNLDTDMFTLGMNDGLMEGQWDWESNGSPVTWKTWVHWTDHGSVPNGGRGKNCALMLRHTQNYWRGHRTEAWADYSCMSDSFLITQPKSLICQRITGRWNFLERRHS